MIRRRVLIREMKNKRSVFVRIFILMVALVVMLSAFMMFWTNRIAQENNRRLIAEGKIRRLETMNAAAEQMVRSASYTLSQMMWSKDFMDFMISCGSENESRDYRIVRMLQSGVKGENNILRKILFGSESSGKLYQSDLNGYMDPRNSETYQSIKVYQDSGMAVFLGQEENIASYMVCTGRRVLLICYLQLGGSDLGMIIGEFDQSRLRAVVSQEDPAVSAADAGESTSEGIYIYDVNDLPVLNPLMDYSAAEGCLSDSSKFVRVGETDDVTVDDGWYYLRSELLGWQYLMRIDMSGTGVSLADTAGTSLPILLVLLLVICSVVFYVVKTLYQPIDELMNQIVPASRGQDKNASVYRNPEAKIEALYGVYSQAQLRQEELQNTIQSMAPAVLEVTMRRLLNGRSVEEDRLQEILEGCGNSLPRTGRYVVCACVVEEPDNRSVSEREFNLYILSLQNILQELNGENDRRFMIRMGRNAIAVLMGFSSDETAVSIKRECLEMIQQMMKKTGPLPYRLWAEFGQICGSLDGVHESYLEALEKIQYKKYSDDGTLETMREENTEVSECDGDGAGTELSSSKITRGYIRERAREMTIPAVRGELDQAMAVQHRLMDEIVGEASELNRRKELYKSFLDELMEKVIAYPLTQEEQKMITGANLADVRIAAAGEEDLPVFMEERGRLICQLLGNYGKKNQYKYVQQAKDYIDTHYADSDLSLNDVAESIGISASYLSELFNEVGGSKFSTYLAEYRVEKARQLMQATTLTIRDIGFQCGFNSVQNFIRVFKKISGYTPGQYREHLKQTE